jgi:hypothetical protein
LNRGGAEDAHAGLCWLGKDGRDAEFPRTIGSQALSQICSVFNLTIFPYHTFTTKTVRVMAIIRKLEKIILDKDSTHTETDATYAIVQSEGESYLQIDTYGSKDRKMEGKKSQSIRLSNEAIDQLQSIIKENKLGSH